MIKVCVCSVYYNKCYIHLKIVIYNIQYTRLGTIFFILLLVETFLVHYLKHKLKCFVQTDTPPPTHTTPLKYIVYIYFQINGRLTEIYHLEKLHLYCQCFQKCNHYIDKNLLLIVLDSNLTSNSVLI